MTSGDSTTGWAIRSGGAIETGGASDVVGASETGGASETSGASDNGRASETNAINNWETVRQVEQKSVVELVRLRVVILSWDSFILLDCWACWASMTDVWKVDPVRLVELMKHS